MPLLILKDLGDSIIRCARHMAPLSEFFRESCSKVRKFQPNLLFLNSLYTLMTVRPVASGGDSLETSGLARHRGVRLTGTPEAPEGSWPR